MVMNNSILRALAFDSNDYPEEILESYDINYDGWSEDEICDKSEDLLNQYKVVDEELLYTDLEKSYQRFRMVFEYEGQLYAVEYVISPFFSPELRSQPFRVEKTTRTITIT